LACDVSNKLPLAGKIIDAVSWNGDRDLDAILGSRILIVHGLAYPRPPRGFR